MDDTPDVELGPVSRGSFGAFREAYGATFASRVATPEASPPEWIDVDRLVAARLPDGQIVGTAGNLSFDISLPGGRSAPCAGVTVATVRADHRRRGLLTRMMARLLDDAQARSESFAALWASESPIYGRFGFGPAVPTVTLDIDRRHLALHLDGPRQEIRLVDIDEARRTFPELHERFRATRPGVMARSSPWWTRVLAEDPTPLERTGPLRLALLADRGYAVYHLDSKWVDDVPQGAVQVHDLVALDPGAVAALWRFVGDTDLAVRVEATRRAPDDPLLAMLVDPGRATVRAGWPLYLRLVDLPAALMARGYLVDAEIVIEVHDAFRPGNAGLWRVRATDGEAVCARTARKPALVMDAEVLAAVSLGGTRTTAWHAAGRVQGSFQAAVELDRLLASERAPTSDLMF